MRGLLSQFGTLVRLWPFDKLKNKPVAMAIRNEGPAASAKIARPWLGGCVWMSTHSPHIAAVCCLSSFSVFLPISLARETGDADPCPVMYITAWGTVFFYACSAHTGQAIGIGGGASHAMPEEEMPFATDERRCRAIARRKERPTWSDRAAIVIILIVLCCVSY